MLSLLLGWALSLGAEAKKVYITQGYMEELFPERNIAAIPDDTPHIMQKLYKVAALQGYELIPVRSGKEISSEIEKLILFEVFPEQIASFHAVPKEKKVLFLWEPPTVLPDNYNPRYHAPFARIYTWNDTLVDDQTYFKLYYPCYRPMLTERPSFAEKKLCTLIAMNKGSSHPRELYSHRRRVIAFFEHHHTEDFDLLGRFWPLGLKTYRGAVDDKLEALKHYRFSFCYENISQEAGYVTEKIFDCFAAGVVPIYWGANNIEQYIPKACFIAREEFQDEETLYRFLKAMTEQQYATYIEAIQAYLKSPEAKTFSADDFILLFMNLLNQ